MYDRKLNPEEEAQIKAMMDYNPVLDYLIAETIVKMPKDDLDLIVKKHKEGKLKNDLPEVTEYVLKTGKVLEE